MIIDCHGHYTTAPKALEAWRNRQIAGIKDPPAAPKVAELKISDDELRELIELNQLKLMKERGCDLTVFSPARQLHGPSHRRLRRQLDLGCDLQRAVLPRLAALPRQFHRRGDAAAEPRVEPKTCIPELDNACATTASSPSISIPIRPGGHWTSPPLTDRWWYPIYEKMVEWDIPAMVHVSTSCNPASTPPAPITSTPTRPR